MPEYRPVEADEVKAYRSVLDYAFRADAGPDPERDEDEPGPLGRVAACSTVTPSSPPGRTTGSRSPSGIGGSRWPG